LAGGRIENQLVVCGWLAEVKKAIQRSGFLVERAFADAAQAPIVFDEAATRNRFAARSIG
jgi:hypothetical protein